jgi:predicted acylesterase/phospholipase RssA
MPIVTLPSSSTIRTNTLLGPDADFHRLARRLLGKTIALVLGGGGARGVAHLGVIKAFQERGIPFDVIGGTSIGAFIGTAYARDLSFEGIYEKVRGICMQLVTWKFLSDLTYPWIAMTSGHRFNNLIQGVFGEMDILETWIETYCAVTNLSKNVSHISPDSKLCFFG